MRNLLLIFIAALAVNAVGQVIVNPDGTHIATVGNTVTIPNETQIIDKEEIQNLIRRMLNWAWSSEHFNPMPMLLDNPNDVYFSGFDFVKHEANIERLRATGFFANEFIENFNRIILTLDSMYRNNEFGKWYVIYGMPHFGFDSGADIWCDCQDIPFDYPNVWDYVEVEIIEIDDNSASLVWRWGPLDKVHPAWNERPYRFRTVREDGNWRIAYLQEFDFEKITQRGGF